MYVCSKVGSPIRLDLETTSKNTIFLSTDGTIVSRIPFSLLYDIHVHSIILWYINTILLFSMEIAHE